MSSFPGSALLLGQHTAIFESGDTGWILFSAALILRELSARMRSSGLPWQLDDDDSRDLLLRWMRRSIKNSDHLIERFLAENAAGRAAGH